MEVPIDPDKERRDALNQAKEQAKFSKTGVGTARVDGESFIKEFFIVEDKNGDGSKAVKDLNPPE